MFLDLGDKTVRLRGENKKEKKNCAESRCQCDTRVKAQSTTDMNITKSAQLNLHYMIIAVISIGPYLGGYGETPRFTTSTKMLTLTT